MDTQSPLPYVHQIYWQMANAAKEKNMETIPENEKMFRIYTFETVTVKFCNIFQGTAELLHTVLESSETYIALVAMVT